MEIVIGLLFLLEINGTDGYLNVDGRFDTHGGDMIYWKSKDQQSNNF